MLLGTAWGTCVNFIDTLGATLGMIGEHGNMVGTLKSKKTSQLKELLVIILYANLLPCK
jgi:hypothetical protein